VLGASLAYPVECWASSNFPVQAGLCPSSVPFISMAGVPVSLLAAVEGCPHAASSVTMAACIRRLGMTWWTPLSATTSQSSQRRENNQSVLSSVERIEAQLNGQPVPGKGAAWWQALHRCQMFNPPQFQPMPQIAPADWDHSAALTACLMKLWQGVHGHQPVLLRCSSYET